MSGPVELTGPQTEEGTWVRRRGPGVVRGFRALSGLVGLSALALQYGLALGAGTGSGVASVTLNFFSYFTVLTNALVAAGFVAPVLGPGTRVGRAFKSVGARAALAMYAAVVGLTYHFALSHVWDPQGWLFVANGLLHYVMPAAMLVDWLAFTPRGGLRWVDPLKWLAFPLIYACWILLHGGLSGWWPYWFIDVGELGLERAAINFSGLLAAFLVIGLGMVGVDRRLSRRRGRDSGDVAP